MLDRLVPEEVSGQVRESILGSQPSIAKTEKDAILDIGLRRPGMSAFINPAKHGALGNWMAMRLCLVRRPFLLSRRMTRLRTGVFSGHKIWVTRYKSDEIYASGTYVIRNKELDGLSANRPIEKTDIVGWYTLGFHHVVLLEDWPVMPTPWHGFVIRLADFLDKNPVLTLPQQP